MKGFSLMLCLTFGYFIGSAQWTTINDNKVYTSGEYVEIIDAQPRLRLYDNSDGENRYEGELYEGNNDIHLESSVGKLILIPKTELIIRHPMFEYARMNSAGNWGFGINDPKDKIHLDGDIRFEGTERMDWYDGVGRMGSLVHEGFDMLLQNEINNGDILIATDRNFSVLFEDGIAGLTATRDLRVGIGNEFPQAALDVNGDVIISGEMSAASDLRLKKDIHSLEKGLQLIQRLNPVSYNFRTKEFPKMRLAERRKMGLIAQEVERILPNLVTSTKNENGEDMLSVNYIELIPLLIKALQEVVIELEQNKDELAVLRQRISSIKQ